MRPLLKGTASNEAFTHTVALQTDIFTVYNNASARVGKIDDARLRDSIVETYARGKGFLYSIQANNQMITEISDLETKRWMGAHIGGLQASIEEKRQRMIRFAQSLKAFDEELERLVNDMQARACEWTRKKESV